MLDANGRNLRTLLGKGDGIHKPLTVRVDTEGKQFVIINRNGCELRNYRMNIEHRVQKDE